MLPSSRSASRAGRAPAAHPAGPSRTLVLPCALLAALAGCRGDSGGSAFPPPVETLPAVGPEAEPPQVMPAFPARELPEGWDRVPPRSFEDLLPQVREAGGRFAWSPSALGRLVQALGRADETSVRAAVLLAHSSHPSAVTALLARLEARAVPAARGLDGGDVVAAAALSEAALAANDVQRLVELASGPAPHPVLDVRVEIARSALAHGAEQVIPFLIRVLRAMTPAEADDPPDWERVTTLAWPKTRAAEALGAYLGEARPFPADGSWEDQMRAAERFEELAAER